jgi:RNA polymerase sigma-70 factor (ECF subfamily)
MSIAFRRATRSHCVIGEAERWPISSDSRKIHIHSRLRSRSVRSCSTVLLRRRVAELLQYACRLARIVVTVTLTTTGYSVVNSLMASAVPPRDPDDTDQLLTNAAIGDSTAIGMLLERHRERLRRMIALRLDDRLAARVDASDVVQETLVDAARKLADYTRNRPLPFYPWLHRLAAERLAAVHRQHRRSKGRSVSREEAGAFAWPDSSVQLIVNSLAANEITPGDLLVREEQRRQLHKTLQELAPIDREILMMHYLEELSFPEIATILDIGEGAAKMRHLRALQRIRTLMASGGSEAS